uniref:ATP synthase complex subunit 8 n=1 Tax=Neocyema erythrosoma TaxID=2024705 RepID=A0A347ZJT1_9TELE|nr:ATP synthase F0 subunit 8 [Neocyema erythrosoma]BBA85496.1 ATPase subunits 8 [Neocyema erythrosoma]
MPQLNPSPWLKVATLSWIAYAVVLPPKILKLVFDNDPNQTNSCPTQQTPWNWPWL